MSEQIFISYRREGGDVTAKLICEALKNRGYTVFYDFDSLRGGYFDERIYKAIEECNDFVLVLPPRALDRCVNENDWVRLEIKHAIESGKNIIPVLLPGFSFIDSLPNDIASVARINGIDFVMAYFDAVISAIIERFSAATKPRYRQAIVCEPVPPAKTVEAPSAVQNISRLPIQDDVNESSGGSVGLEYTLGWDESSYKVSLGQCTDTDIVIPKTFNGKPVTDIGEKAFFKCSQLTSIVLPEGIKTISNYAFKGCSSLTSINLPNSLTHIGCDAFGLCRSLDSVCLSENVSYISGWAFSTCSSLTSISIPKLVEKIFDNTFIFCESLTSVNIPSSVIEIKSKAFAYCSSLESINYNGTVDQWRKVVLGDKCFSDAVRFIRCTDGDVVL